MIVAIPFGSVFAAAFLFNHDFILFGYKTERDFHTWAPSLNTFKTQFWKSYFYILFAM